jgi:hypothetical protein
LPLTLLSNHRLSTKFEKKTEAASRDWISAFIKINQTLSICTQEQTSQGRTNGSKKEVVAKFFEILKEVNESSLQFYNFSYLGHWRGRHSNSFAPPPPESRHYKRSKASAKKLSLTNAALILLCLPSFLLGGTHIPPVFIFQRNFFYRL